MAAEARELLRMAIRCDPAAPAAIRGSMSSLRGLGWALQDSILIASELVTGAVRRSDRGREDWIEVRVTRRADSITITVSGPSSAVACDHDGDADGLGLDEMGMVIMDQLARRWGRLADPGYKVWAEVPLAATI